MALAATPNSVKVHLGKSIALANAMSALKALPDFDEKVSQLTGELSAADAGYASASRAVKQWLENSQQSNSRALARLKGHHDLLSSSTTLVERSTLHASIKDWWASEDPTLVLLGDEGTGKSWAALSWWYKLAESENAPLTIFLPAKDVQGNDPFESIATHLARITELRDCGFWRRRLALWEKAAKPLPILLILDGLNQNWSKRDWTEFLQPMLDDKFRGRFRVLMTCWPDWWTSIGALKSLKPEVNTLNVTNFSDSELNKLLELHGLAREDFSGELCTLIRVPRLFSLALKHREELSESGDITAERLAYEDWKHRLSLGTARADWSDEEFQDFIAGLGGELRANFETATLTTKELVERLGRESGAEAADLKATIQDLVAGRWLQPSGTPHQYRINKEMAPFVLGIALASQLRTVDGLENASTQLADFVDPYRGQSLGVAIIRAAATAALLDPSVGSEARKALLLRWLHEQNFGAADFEAWWRLTGADTELFCSLIEDQWLYPDRRGSVSEDEVFIKGLANAYDFDVVAPKIRDALTKWLGWIWPDPDEGQFIGSIDPHSERSKKNRASVLENIEHWARQSDKADWPTVHYLAEGNVSWLNHRAFGVLSFIPKAPLASAIEAWAISRSILARPRHFDELAWVLRLNNEDEIAAREMVLNIVERLEARSKQETNRAAQWLLEALGDKDCLDRAASIESSLASDQVTVSVTRNHEAQSSHFDPNHSHEFGPPSIPNGANLWSFLRSQGKDDVTFKEVEIPLCRTDPQRLKSVLSQAVASACKRTDEQLTGLSRQIKDFVLVLSEVERLTLAKELRERAGKNGIDSGSAKTWRRTAGILELWDKTTLEQFEILEGNNFEAETIEGIFDALSVAKSEHIPQIARILPTVVGAEAQNVVLCFLLETAATEAAKSWPALETLVLDDNEIIRHRAIQVAATGKSEVALRAFVASGWAAKEDHSLDEKAYGSLALSYASDLFDNPALLDRADPEIWGWRLQHTEHKELNLAKFHDFLRLRVSGEDRRKTRSFPRHAWGHEDAVRTLLAEREADFFKWFSPWLDAHPELPWGSLHETFPFIDLGRVLIEKGHPEGRRLWQKLVKAEKTGINKYSDLHFFPLFSPDIIGDRQIQDAVPDFLTTDAKIRDFVWFAFEANRTKWLADLIREDVTAQGAYRQARGWKLLGLSDCEELFCGLWEELDRYRPLRGWLKDVADYAEKEFERNKWARHWYELHIKSTDVVTAYTTFQLMARCVDGRARFWMKKMPIDTAPLKNVIRPHWQLQQETLNTDIKSHNKNEKEHLLGLTTMRYTQAPWF